MEVPSQSLHLTLSRICSQMEAPPHSLHLLLTWLCSHRDALINDAQVETSLRKAWEHEGSKDEMNIVLQGPEQYF